MRSPFFSSVALNSSIIHPEERPFPLRYSRHYYDLYKMARTPVKDNALQDNDLLERVYGSKINFTVVRGQDMTLQNAEQ